MWEAFGSGSWLASTACCLRRPSWFFHMLRSLSLGHYLQATLSSTADPQLKAWLSGWFWTWHSFLSFITEEKEKGVKTMIRFYCLKLPWDCCCPLLSSLHLACQNHFLSLFKASLSRPWALTLSLAVCGLPVLHCRAVSNKLSINQATAVLRHVAYIFLCNYFWHKFLTIGTQEDIAAKTSSHNDKALVFQP